MRSIDISKKRKELKPKPKKNFNPSSLKLHIPRYKKINILLIMLAFTFSLYLIYIIINMPYIKTEIIKINQNQSNESSVPKIEEKITIYINSEKEEDLNEIKKKLNQSGTKADIVYSRFVNRDIIYYAKEHATQVVKLNEIFQKEFILQEIMSAQATGIVVYYKK